MPIAAAELGFPGNLEKLNFIVGIINGKSTFIAQEDEKCWERIDEDGACIYVQEFSPTTDANQCLEATPYCEVRPIFMRSIGKYGYSCGVIMVPSGIADLYIEHESELIARCLALVLSVYGNEVPDSVLEIDTAQ